MKFAALFIAGLLVIFSLIHVSFAKEKAPPARHPERPHSPPPGLVIVPQHQFQKYPQPGPPPYKPYPEPKPPTYPPYPPYPEPKPPTYPPHPQPKPPIYPPYPPYPEPKPPTYPPHPQPKPPIYPPHPEPKPPTYPPHPQPKPPIYPPHPEPKPPIYPPHPQPKPPIYPPHPEPKPPTYPPHPAPKPITYPPHPQPKPPIYPPPPEHHECDLCHEVEDGFSETLGYLKWIYSEVAQGNKCPADVVLVSGDPSDSHVNPSHVTCPYGYDLIDCRCSTENKECEGTQVNDGKCKAIKSVGAVTPSDLRAVATCVPSCSGTYTIKTAGFAADPPVVTCDEPNTKIIGCWIRDKEADVFVGTKIDVPSNSCSPAKVCSNLSCQIQAVCKNI